MFNIQANQTYIDELYDQIYATLYGQCIGDALGLLTETLTKSDAKRVGILLYRPTVKDWDFHYQFSCQVLKQHLSATTEDNGNQNSMFVSVCYW